VWAATASANSVSGIHSGPSRLSEADIPTLQTGRFWPHVFHDERMR
jgi:hypothetical protein